MLILVENKQEFKEDIYRDWDMFLDCVNKRIKQSILGVEWESGKSSIKIRGPLKVRDVRDSWISIQNNSNTIVISEEEFQFVIEQLRVVSVGLKNGQSILIEFRGI